MQNQSYSQQNFSNNAAYFNFEKNKPGTYPLIKNDPEALIRAKFLGDTYGVLALELFITLLMCIFSLSFQSFRDFQLNNTVLPILMTLLLIASVLAAICGSHSIPFPTDLIIVIIFIISFSYMVSFGCSTVAIQQSGQPVIITIGSTFIAVLSITLYVRCGNVNFQICFGIVMVMGTSFIGAIITTYGTPIIITFLCWLGVVIYGIYLVIVTKWIIKGQHTDFPMESYLLASILIYVYIINFIVTLIKNVTNSTK